MNLELTDEQVALRDTVRRFMTEKAGVATYVRPLLDDLTGTTAQVWGGLAALGATGLLVPEQCGGAGMTMVEAGIIAEELGAALDPGPWRSCAVAATRTLASLADDEAVSRLLAGIASGSAIVTVGPLGAARPEAVSTGQGVVVRGEIAALPDAAAADVLLVIGEDRSGTALYTVDAVSARVTATPRASLDPTRKVFDVGFDDAPARRLGSISADDLGAVVDDVLIAGAADALGAAQRVMTLAIEYAKVRMQFGQPIGSFQAVQHLCVDMYETVDLARSGVIHALWAADAADPAERHLAAWHAKAFAGRLASVGDTAIQVFGGIGYTWEHDAHLYLKRLLSWAAYLGGADDYLEQVGAHVVSRSHRKVLQ